MKRMADYGAEATSTTLEPARPSETERKQELADAEQKTVRLARLAAAEAFDEARQLISQVRTLREAGQLKDPAKSAQYLATTGAIFTDKANVLEGKPTSIVGHHDSEDTWHQLAERLGAVDSTASEMTDATEVPDQRSLGTATQQNRAPE